MIRKIIFILSVLGTFNYGMAQSMSFSRVGSVGAFSDRGYVASLAISFNKVAECVKLNTGVSLFGSSIGQREFFVSCAPSSVDEYLDFTLYPNPVVNYTRLVAAGTVSSLNQYLLAIIDATGRLVWKEKVTASDLRSGHILKIAHFSAGNYFLRVEGSGFSRVIPFVKVH